MWPEYAVDLDSDELCLIDSQITSLLNIPTSNNVRVLNVHCNLIAKIEGLDRMRLLCHLDLSSNKIQSMDGLSALTSLRTLNLSCNLITGVTGLENLRSLAKLNLSYNRIQDLSGFCQLHKDAVSFCHLELHGNLIASQHHLVDCLSRCAYLRHLVVSQGTMTNPFCQQPGGYWRDIMDRLPQLSVLDGLDRHGMVARADNDLIDMPGLENYVDFLLPSKPEVPVDSINALSVTTPKIDAALDLFKRRVTVPQSSSSVSRDYDTSGGTGVSSNDVSMTTQVATPRECDTRLERLEEQLRHLMQRNAQSPAIVKPSERASNASKTTAKCRPKKHLAKRDIDETDESESSIGRTKVKSAGRKSRQAAIRKDAASPKAKSIHAPSMSSPCGTDDTVRSHGTISTQQSPAADPRGGKPSTRQDALNDSQQRDSIQESYMRLISELDEERERRWKVEQTSGALQKELQQLQVKVKDGEERHGMTVEKSDQLQVALAAEHNVKTEALEENKHLKDQLSEMTQRLAAAQKREDDCRTTIAKLEDSLSAVNAEHQREKVAHNKAEQQARMRVSAASRQAELLRAQLQQVQELLVSRENEHRKEMQGRFSLNSPELQKLLHEETEKTEKLHQQQQQAQSQKIDLLAKQYGDLENEFRLALQIEAARFKELQNAYQQASQTSAHNEQALEAANQKDAKTSTMIAELTAMVKEQKGRITELSRSKQEQTVFYKERVDTLETHLDEARRRMVQLELLKKEKAKLDAQVQAQESMINGLKEERRLWGEELAHQGASLSQDRGRLESRIETLNIEVSSLKKELENQADAVRIKTKVIDDQTETIKKLKEGLLERDAEIKSIRAESIEEHKELEERLETESQVNLELQEKLDRCHERKDELKQELVELEEKLEASKQAQSSLSSRWKEKSTLIQQLESQVKQMKSTWDAQEVKLTQERDKAINAASLAVEKLKRMDDSFRQQLEAKEASHQAALNAAQTEHKAELNAAEEKVLAVEAEMRELLLESQASKRAMEERVKKLNHAFSELQQGVF